MATHPVDEHPEGSVGDVSRRVAMRRIGGGLAAAAALGRTVDARAAAVPAAQQRGSDRMLECQFGQATEVSEDHLKQMLELSKVDGVDFFEWFPYGVVAQRIDGVFGTIQVKADAAPGVLSQFVDMASSWRHWEVFPYGITVPDLYEISFGTHGTFPVAELPG